MDRNVRYQRLPSVEVEHEPLNTERNEAATDGATELDMPVEAPPSHQDSACASPPPYMLQEERGAEANPAVAGQVPKYDPNSPPSYTVATELPTYDQVQQLKLEEGVQSETLTLDPETLERGDALLGTDFMFLCAFFVSFLFNWIGFLMLMCFCPTIAGRYGALAGFGLSLAKWTLIVKHSTDLINTDNNWLWWLILAFGVLICVRAVLQYLHVKREWHLLTRATQQRLMYFY